MVENLGPGELDRSKPFVPNLESSSQLEDSSSGNEAVPVRTIDATPLPVRKRGVKRGRKAAVEDAENKPPAVSVCVCVYSTLVQVPCISIGYQEVCPAKQEEASPHTSECESSSAQCAHRERGRGRIPTWRGYGGDIYHTEVVGI